jgi:hypothetical protein
VSTSHPRDSRDSAGEPRLTPSIAIHRPTAPSAEEAAGIKRHLVAEDEVAELILEARHGELNREPRAARDGGGGGGVGGEVVDGGEVVPVANTSS